MGSCPTSTDLLSNSEQVSGLICLPELFLVSHGLSLGLSRSEATIMIVISNIYQSLTMC